MPNRWDNMIDIPTIPPSMILLGTRNSSSPTAANPAPMASNNPFCAILIDPITSPSLRMGNDSPSAVNTKKMITNLFRSSTALWAGPFSPNGEKAGKIPAFGPRRYPLGPCLSPGRSGVEGVPESIADEIDRQHGDDDHHPGRNPQPRLLGQNADVPGSV